MRVTLRQLAYFEALARSGSFSAAAAAMHVTQPALSMQIRELETHLGGALVERLPREVRLTPRGRTALEHARDILGQVRGLEAAMRRDGPGGRIDLGLIPTVAPYLLPVVLRRRAAQGRAPSLRVREAVTGDLVDDLLAGRLDAAVIAAPDRHDRLVWADLAEDAFHLAGTPARLAGLTRRLEALRPTDIDPDQLLLLDDGHCLADQALAACALDRRARRVDLGASSLTTLCRLVAAGHGLTLLPGIAVASETAAAPGLATLRFCAPEPARRLVLARRVAADGASTWFDDLTALLRDGLRELAELPGAATGVGSGHADLAQDNPPEPSYSPR